MKNKTEKIALGTMAAASVGLLFVGINASSNVTGGAENSERVVLTMGDYEMTEGEFYTIMRDEPMGQNVSFGESVLRQQIVERLLEKEYGDETSDEEVDKKLEELISMYGGDEAYKEYLDSEGLTADFMRNDVRVSILMEKAIRKHVKLDEEELKEMYNDQIASGTRVAHILVDEKELAEELIEKLNKGEDFKKLVKEYSTDGGSVDNGGEYNFIKGEFVPAFEEAALELKEGEMTKEPVQSELGYHIIKRVQDVEKPSFEEAKGELEDEWYHNYVQANQDTPEEVVRELLKKESVKIKDSQLKETVKKMMEKPEVPEQDGDTEEGTVIYSSDDDPNYSEENAGLDIMPEEEKERVKELEKERNK